MRIVGVVVLVMCTFWVQAQKEMSPIDYVNPFIGTTNYGATHPGPVLPHGMASVVPFNVAFKKGAENQFEKDSEWHSRPYVNENKFLTGFSHVNLSGVGCPDLGSILTMPTHGELILDAERYGSTFSDEQSTPGHYSMTIDEGNIGVDLSATLRAGISKYRFPKGKNNIILNLGLGLTNETGASMKIVSPTEIEGYKMIGTFCYNPEDVRPVYFVMRVSKTPIEYGAWKEMPPFKGVEADWTAYNDTLKPYPSYRREISGDNIGAYLSYNFEKETEVYVKIGVSYSSIEHARMNLDKEIPAYDMEGIVGQAQKAWNDKLSRISIDADDTAKTLFYTALYHIFMHPNILQDVDGTYPAMESHENLKTDKNRYTVFSLWDTYRNLHPFLSLAYPEVQSDMIHSMLDMYDESGWLPKWELLSMETSVMVGDPATPVIADSYMRGIRDFDTKKAYEAMRKSAFTTEKNKLRPGNKSYVETGIIKENEKEKVWGTVSTTLEYNISDFNLAQMAREIGEEDDAKILTERSMSYKKYFDDSTGMLRPIMQDGEFLSPFNPEAGKNFEPVIGFVEGNAWQYRFYVPHDIKGLKKMLGGDEAMEKALDACFATDNYDMANEPDITYPFLYNYLDGASPKADAKVHELIAQYYTNTPAGIPGNDDTGTLSTWLIFSMLGLYPDCPGEPHYTLTSPVVNGGVIELNSTYYKGETIEIKVTNRVNPTDVVKEVRWNGKILKKRFILHSTLVKGGVLEWIY